MKVTLIFLLPITILLFTTDLWYLGIFLCAVMYEITEDDKEFDNIYTNYNSGSYFIEIKEWSSMQIRRLYNAARYKLSRMRKM